MLFNDSPSYENRANLVGYDSLWGYDPGQPRRYTQLIACAQGDLLALPDVYKFSAVKMSRIFQLLRCRYVFGWNSPESVEELRDPMPHVKLIGAYQKLDDPAKIVDLLANHNFDFTTRAILEADPQPVPTTAGASGRVTLLRQSINDLEIQADLADPALLLITDSYAPGWHVRAIELNANQSHYEILRADDVLRAIPLAAGHHHFDVYYLPPGLWAGECLSFVAGLVLLARSCYRPADLAKSDFPWLKAGVALYILLFSIYGVIFQSISSRRARIIRAGGARSASHLDIASIALLGRQASAGLAERRSHHGLFAVAILWLFRMETWPLPVLESARLCRHSIFRTDSIVPALPDRVD